MSLLAHNHSSLWDCYHYDSVKDYCCLLGSVDERQKETFTRRIVKNEGSYSRVKNTTAVVTPNAKLNVVLCRSSGQNSET